MIPGLEYESASFDNGNGSSTTDFQHEQQQQYPSSYVDYGGGAATSSPASSVNSYSSINLNTPSSSFTTTSSTPSSSYPELRRRQIRPDNNDNGFGYASPNYDTSSKGSNNNKSSVTKLAKKLDVFPKTERDYTIRTDRGGQLTAIGYGIMIILILAEYMTWKSMNSEHNEHIIVDTR
jgi:hypothetical protein